MQVYMGIDWSERKHDVMLINEAGAVIAQRTVPHSQEGFLQLDWTRSRVGVASGECAVALETAHNLLIDFLWARGYSEIYVMSPNMVKGNRSRYGQSGARTDSSDAYLLADAVRTDRGRLRPWHPDSLLTRQIRAKVSLISFLTRNIVALSNRLRSTLLRYYPAALEVFSSIRTRIALQFICSYPSPQIAAALTFPEFAAFARKHRYPRPSRLPTCFARLQGKHAPVSAETAQVYQDEAVLLATTLLERIRVKATTLDQLQDLFQQHPDAPIFTSLPGAGDYLAPALLAKFGDHRQRFPTASGVQALAGTCPVTDKSGKRKIIKFRWACDHEFRRIAQQWAILSRRQSVWANTYWLQVRPRCRTDSQAYRRLANRWLAIAWKLWQTRQSYDEEYHLRQCALRSKPRC
jgi:transposase